MNEGKLLLLVTDTKLAYIDKVCNVDSKYISAYLNSGNFYSRNGQGKIYTFIVDQLPPNTINLIIFLYLM